MTHFKHSDHLRIETPRLVLRKFCIYDAEDMLEPTIQGNYDEPTYSTLEGITKLIDKWLYQYSIGDYYRWAIIETNNNKCIGQIAFCRIYSQYKTAEIEYCIGRKFWGHGYAMEALNAVIKYSFQNTDFEILEAYHIVENKNSGRVLQKSNMKIVSNVRRFEESNEESTGKVCYSITKSSNY